MDRSKFSFKPTPHEPIVWGTHAVLHAQEYTHAHVYTYAHTRAHICTDTHTLTCPSSEPASRRGAAEESGPAMGDSRTAVTVFWKFVSFFSSRPPPTRSHTHSWLPPAVTTSEPACVRACVCVCVRAYGHNSQGAPSSPVRPMLKACGVQKHPGCVHTLYDGSWSLF